jgi:hypothetical protein
MTESTATKTPAPIVHRRKLFDGKTTAEEVYVKSLGKSCLVCGAPALVSIRMFAPMAELDRIQLFKLSLAHEGQVPVVDTIYGKFVRVSQVHACKSCSPTAQREAAKHPSSWFVEIDEGPGAERTLIAL